MSTQGAYIPGVCNIGRSEIRARRIAGWIGVAASLLLVAISRSTGESPAWRLLVFFPATLAAIGFLQSALHFCVGFGFKSVFNFGALGAMENVEQAEFRRLDRNKALTILVGSLAIGVAAALLAYWA